MKLLTSYLARINYKTNILLLTVIIRLLNTKSRIISLSIRLLTAG